MLRIRFFLRTGSLEHYVVNTCRPGFDSAALITIFARAEALSFRDLFAVCRFQLRAQPAKSKGGGADVTNLVFGNPSEAAPFLPKNPYIHLPSEKSQTLNSYPYEEAHPHIPLRPGCYSERFCTGDAARDRYP